MIHIARINVVSGNCIGIVVATSDGALTGACARARNVERGDSAVRGAQETVIHIARVHVLSRDRSRRVDVLGKGALVGPVPPPGTSNVMMVPSAARRNRDSHCSRQCRPR